MEERTSLEEPTPQEQPTEVTRTRWLFWQRDWILVVTIVVVLIADQLTKFAVKGTLRLGESWPSDGLIRVTHGANTGTAFGLLPNQTLFLIFASIIAIGFLVYFYRAYALPRPILRLAIGLQLGGAFGNLFDRVAFGSVTDFIDVGWWPIFNIADSSICVGMTTLIVVLLLFDRKPAEEPALETAKQRKHRTQQPAKRAMSRVLTFESDAKGERLDRFLDSRCPDLSRSRIQALITEGSATLDGKPAKPSARIQEGQVIVLNIPDPVESALKPQRIPLSIVYEDRDLLVVDKPAGMTVHPAPGHPDGTLVNAVLAHCPDLQGIGGTVRPRHCASLGQGHIGADGRRKKRPHSPHAERPTQKTQIHKSVLSAHSR